MGIVQGECHYLRHGFNDSEVYPNGLFVRLEDPEGNPIQLWQPADATQETSE